MQQSRDNGNRVRVLFKVKKGTVTAEVRGPRLGWKWRVINYYRWEISTRKPGTWEKAFPDRTVDQMYLDQCVKAVRAWLRDNEAPAIDEN